MDDNSVVNVRRWRPAGESGDVDDEAEEGLPGKILTRVVRIEPPSPITSYKARYPYLVGEALDAGKMFLFDVRDGRLVKSVNIPVVNINVRVGADRQGSDQEGCRISTPRKLTGRTLFSASFDSVVHTSRATSNLTPTPSSKRMSASSSRTARPARCGISSILDCTLMKGQKTPCGRLRRSSTSSPRSITL